MLSRIDVNRKAAAVCNRKAFCLPVQPVEKVRKIPDFFAYKRYIKIVLIKHLYGLQSLRRTSEKIQMNIANRWFWGYTLNENTPRLSTVSYNFKHRFTEEVIEEVLGWILTEIEKAGYLSPEAIFADGTHKPVEHHPFLTQEAPRVRILLPTNNAIFYRITGEP